MFPSRNFLFPQRKQIVSHAKQPVLTCREMMNRISAEQPLLDAEVAKLLKAPHLLSKSHELN
jgi:hypothetical protein